MIEIKTYIAKFYDSDFPQIERLLSSEYFDIEDKEMGLNNQKLFKTENKIYTPGYIQIEYFGKAFMGKKYWDYIFWLWREILANIDNVIFYNKDIEILFPGQSLHFFIKLNGDYALIGVKEGNNIFEQILLPRFEFLNAFIKNGLEVFSILHEFNQDDMSSLMIKKCKKYLTKLDSKK